MLKNVAHRFGSVSITLHWLIALGVIGEFGLGIYMTGVDYYHSYYQEMPHYHQSIGVILLFLLVLRSIWGWINIRPLPGDGVGIWEHRASKLVKFGMNGLTLVIILCGLLLAFADCDSVSVFSLFEVPPLVCDLPNQEDWSIFWHYWLSWAVMGLATLHTCGAMKHHFIDRDETLRRMLGLSERQD